MRVGMLIAEVFLGRDDKRVFKCGELLFWKLASMGGRKAIGDGLMISSDDAVIEAVVRSDIDGDKKLIVRMFPRGAKYIDRYTEVLAAVIDTLHKCIDPKDVGKDEGVDEE